MRIIFLQNTKLMFFMHQKTFCAAFVELNIGRVGLYQKNPQKFLKNCLFRNKLVG